MITTCQFAKQRRSRGVALVITLLLLSLFTVMTLAMVVATSSDTLIDGYYRNFRSSFYASDSGLNVVRQYMLGQIVAAVPTTFNMNNGGPIPAGTESTVLSSVTNTSAGFGAMQSVTGSQSSWPATFQVDAANTSLGAPTCAATYTGNGTTTPTCSSAGSGYTVTGYQYTYPYTITTIGQSRASEQHKVTENGYLVVTVDAGTPAGNTSSFAAYGMFIDQYSICSGSYLVPGTITGPVFTNGSWTFGTTGHYIFTDAVGSAGANFGYQFSSCYPSSNTSYTSGSQTINPTFQGSVALGQNTVALPTDSFNQEEAVLDGRGDGTTSVTRANMNAILKTVDGSAYPLHGNPSSNVYLPYSTSAGACGSLTPPCMNGGGIYVEGSAKVTLSATTSAGGNPLQVFTIIQGSGGGATTTTVTIDLALQTTKITDGTTTTNLSGVPQNLTSGTPSEAAMLYVNGTITSFSGPSSGPAVQDGSAVTVTAANDIDVTGNVTYKTEPVTLTQQGSTAADTLIAGNNNGQVLGLFTAGGNVSLQMPSSGMNLEIDASIATIKSGGSGALINNGNQINTLNIVGGRIQNTIQNINTTTRNVFFDRRFAQGNFAPPWFPSTTVTASGTVTSVVTASPPVRVSWTDLSAR
jgi:Tfp pilus assembly protein PilX